jgi:hypothetical protein
VITFATFCGLSSFISCHKYVFNSSTTFNNYRKFKVSLVSNIYLLISYIYSNNISLFYETTYSLGLGISKGVAVSDILNHILFHPSIDVEEPSLIVCTFWICYMVSTIVSLASPLFPNM